MGDVKKVLSAENCYVTLCESNSPRVDILEHNRTIIPNLNHFNALEFEQDWDIVKKMFKHFQIPIHKKILGRGRGKICRWATVISFVKYVYDTQSSENILCMEDDIRLHEGFDFRYDEWRNESRFVKLSQWGEFFACNMNSAGEFLEKLYSIGINENNDQWVMKNLDPFRLAKDWKGLLGGENKKHAELCCPPNKGIIRISNTLTSIEKKYFHRKPHSNKTLLEYRLFEPGETLDIQSTLNNI